MSNWKVCAWLAGTTILAGAPLAAADGDLDPDFSVDGLRTVGCATSCEAQAVLAAPEGALLVAGWMEAPSRWTVSRLNGDGGLDLVWAFVFEPIDFVAAGANAVRDVLDLRLDGSQRLLVAGVVETVGGGPAPALARLTSEGALDATFDGDGQFVLADLPVLGELTEVRDAAILADGGAVFVGKCEGCRSPGVSSAFVVKLLPSGALDTGFDDDGWLLFNHPSLLEPHPMAVSVSPSGQVTLAGNGWTFGGQQSNFVMRFTAGGAPDLSFGGGDGISPDLYFPPGLAQEMAIDPDTGAIVLATAAATSPPAAGGLIGLTSDGDLDTDFGAAGVLDLDLEEGVRLDAVAFQSDGRIVAAGTIDANGLQEGGFFLARVLAGGTLDASFDGNGVKRVEFDLQPNVPDQGLAMTLSGGRLVAAGLAPGAATGDAFAILRTGNTSIFTDGFERGATGAWTGE